jgi:glycosyltransferase involved in cell wall biosynthesis
MRRLQNASALILFSAKYRRYNSIDPSISLVISLEIVANTILTNISIVGLHILNIKLSFTCVCLRNSRKTEVNQYAAGIFLMTLEAIKVLAPVGYPWDFTGPRINSKNLLRRKFVPFNKIRNGWDGFTVFNPLDVLNCDIIHAFNRIPLNSSPYVIGFESHLPRLFSADSKYYRNHLYKSLLSQNCRRIVAISNFAKENFIQGLSVSGLAQEQRDLLVSKTTVRYPNVEIGSEPDAFAGRRDLLELTFVGSHFGRKGGCVATRIAEIALEKRLPLQVNIVSNLQVGGSIWTDPSDSTFFEPFLKLLTLPNVRHYGSLYGQGLMELLGRSHFSILTTFSDTFGFSAIESMLKGTPVICTAQGALPEFIADGVNGIVVAPALTAGLSHWGPEYDQRGRPEFEQLYRAEIERMAFESIRKIEALLDDYQSYDEMRAAAFETCKSLFDAKDAIRFWDDIYSSALMEPRQQVLAPYLTTG